MAELAFETIARVFVAIAVLGLLIGLITTIFNVAKEKTAEVGNEEGILKIDGKELSVEGYLKLIEDCRKKGSMAISDVGCYVITDANLDILSELSTQITYFSNSASGKTVFIYYDFESEKVVAK